MSFNHVAQFRHVRFGHEFNIVMIVAGPPMSMESADSILSNREIAHERHPVLVTFMFFSIDFTRRTFSANTVGFTRLLGLLLLVCMVFGWRAAVADTTLTLFSSFAGNVNFIGTQKTLRTQPDTGNSCLIDTGTTTATLTGLPAGATVGAAYLYWAASGATPDYTVTFEGNTLTATTARSYTANYGGTYDYFSGAINVTGLVAAKGNGTYSFTGLTVANGNPWCTSSAVLGGWALLVIYSHPSEDFRVVNVYEGFQNFRGSAITLTPSNFQIPVSPINGKNAHLTWEGDVGNSAPLGGFNEQLTFNGTPLTDGNNPVNNQFNSVSTINTPVDTSSYGVDFDVFDVSAYLSAGQTSATTVYSSGGDLVLLSAQVISTTNNPVGDLQISMTLSGELIPGQNATYSINVINNGPLSEPGPISVVDTLPVGLSYVSASGSGWSCSPVGQVVTCNRSGSLANGTSAPTLTLTIAVSPAATGTITNTATVSGQAFDNISWNNTATDTRNITSYAYYAMEQTVWSGANTVIDDRNNSHGSPVGGASPVLPATASPPDTCRGANIPSNTATGTYDAVNTNIDVDAVIGNRGTISFWYRAAVNWNNGTARMLLDASNDLGNGGVDKNFYLVKEGSGVLRFQVEDSNDQDTAAVTAAFTFAANTWHHIAVTWDMPGDRTQIFVDGVLQATSTQNVNGTLGNTSTLYIGDNRNAGMLGTTNYTGNSANGVIDEFRVYTYVQNSTGVTLDMNISRPCITKNHYAISHSGTGVNCQAEPVTITAHDAAHTAIALTSATTITLTTSTGFGDWALTTGLGTLTNGTANDGIATYQFGNESTVLLALKHTTPAPSPGVNINVTDGAVTETTGVATASEDPRLIFVPSGFRFTDGTNPVTIGTQISSKTSNVAPGAQNLYLQAIRTDTNTGACVGVFPSGTSVNVQMASQCNNPTACVVGKQVAITNNSITTTIASNPNTGVGLYTSVPLLFGANSQAPFSFTYPDAGSISLHARYNVPLQGGGPSPDNLLGSSAAFVVRPFGFKITDPPSGRTGAGSTVFTSAGTLFNTTLTAVVWESADDTNNDGVPDNQSALAANAATPNFGQETTPVTATLSHVLTEPMPGGANGALTVTAPGFSGFVSGAKTQSVSFSEVGIIRLLAATSNYLGSGQDITAGPSTGGLTGVGRFIPHYFDVTPLIHGCVGAGFTYSGQPFAQVRVQARNLGGVTTSNYQDFGSGLVFSKATTISNAGTTTNFTNNVIPASSFALGIGNQTTVTYTFPPNPLPAGKETVPVTLTLRAIDTPDGVSSAGYTEDTAEIRSGRVYIMNAYGSELADLPLPMRVEYYSTDGWISNGADTCSSTALNALSNFQGNLNSGETCVQDTGNPGVSGQGCAAAGLPADRYTSPPSAGSYNLNLKAPGAGNDGSVDVSANLAAKIWLRYDWDDDGTRDDSSGRATFGLYRGSPRHIYQRERY